MLSAVSFKHTPSTGQRSKRQITKLSLVLARKQRLRSRRTPNKEAEKEEATEGLLQATALYWPEEGGVGDEDRYTPLAKQNLRNIDIPYHTLCTTLAAKPELAWSLSTHLNWGLRLAARFKP